MFMEGLPREGSNHTGCSMALRRRKPHIGWVEIHEVRELPS